MSYAPTDVRHPARLGLAVAAATAAAATAAVTALWLLRVVVTLGLLLVPAP